MTQMTRITLARRPDGAPVQDDFKIETQGVPQPGDGEVVIATSHLSLDPYMRGRMNDGPSYAPPVALGEVMTGQGVGEVIASNAPGFAPGDKVLAVTGWASHAVLPAGDVSKLPDGIDPIHALGVLGMPGFTGWAGMRAYGRPKAGQTLVVAAATGPVGSMVGQIAKAAGMRTVGIVGGAEKMAIARDHFGFDAVLDHKTYADASSLRVDLAQAAPDGIDIYWENVGGKVLEAVIPLMNTAGRIPVCGTVAWYSGSGDSADCLPLVWRSVLTKRLSVNGFIIFDHYHEFPQFMEDMLPMVQAGKILSLEDITDGIENMPGAFIDLLAGRNTGKAVIKV